MYIYIYIYNAFLNLSVKILPDWLHVMFLPFTNLASKNNKFLISRFRKKKKKKKEEALCKRKAKGHRWHFYLHDVATDIDPIVPCKS
jgi:hypothetical protein